MRAWASQEGSYIYHQFLVSGPASFYGAASSYTDGTNTTHIGVEITTGTLASPSSVHLRFLGALAAKPATSVEGDFFWDSTNHGIAFATGTSSGNDKWMRSVTTGSSWTTY